MLCKVGFHTEEDAQISDNPGQLMKDQSFMKSQCPSGEDWRRYPVLSINL